MRRELLERVTRPTLMLDEERARANIRRMARKMERAGVRLRPHFKTHQSPHLGEWFRQAGTTAITVSSVEMAQTFARAGWSDITVAVPVNLRQQDELRVLAREVDLGLLVDDEAVLQRLAAALDSPVRLWIKIDAGYGRAGIHWDRAERVVALAAAVEASGAGRFVGLLAHAGHSYGAGSIREIQTIHEETVDRMSRLRERVLAAGIARCEISIGDTPCCSVAEFFGEVDEVRPGNYVFYDLMQSRLGACRGEDIAVSVACPVIGVYPERNQVVLYGGAVHLSKDYISDDNGLKLYGCLAYPADAPTLTPDPECRVVSLSQEHGVVSVPPDVARNLTVGDVVLVIPVHSCLTAEMYSDYLVWSNSETIPRR